MKFFSTLYRVYHYLRFGIPTTIEKKVEVKIAYLEPAERLKGKNIIITGGGSGLGASMAERFVAEGARVLIVGRNVSKLQLLSQKIGCQYKYLDINEVNTFASFITEADKYLGKINCLVNNAGVSLHEKTFFDVTPETFDAQINTNFRGTFFLTQAFISYLLQRNLSGNVLFISSETGETVDCRPYGFTKASINSMVKGLAHLFAKDNIRINAVAPGVTATDMTGFSSEGNLYCNDHHMERIYLPSEVSEVACFLLSDVSGCVSGQIVTCNNAKTVNPRWK